MVSDLDYFANLSFWNYDRASWPLHIEAAASLPCFLLKLMSLTSSLSSSLLFSTPADSYFLSPTLYSPYILDVFITYLSSHLEYCEVKSLPPERDWEHSPARLALSHLWCTHSLWTPGCNSCPPIPQDILLFLLSCSEKTGMCLFFNLKCTAVCRVFPF